ncbi:MAG TPA: hypothetical protein VJ650_05420 [Gemmatimonadaceae bacterium]|nr:hypothetical protein [Gemmatimonadaceae bacterium]
MTFSPKYLAEAVVLLGIAWAVIRWIGRSLLDISGGSRDAEGHRFLESIRRPLATKSQDSSPFARAASRETAAAGREDPRYTDKRRVLDVTFRELRADGPIANRAAAMSEAERQAIYDDLVARLEAGNVSDAERAFALAVAMKRLGLKGGRAAAEVVKKL